MVWAKRQWKDNYCLSFSDEAEKVMHCFTNVFSDAIFYPRALQWSRVRKTIVAVLKVCGPRIYQSENCHVQ